MHTKHFYSDATWKLCTANYRCMLFKALTSLFLQADVLAYCALPNLNDSGATGTSGEALKLVGGTKYIEACKPLTNISYGDVACTVGGDLACKYVLHAVGCGMKVSKEKNEKVCFFCINLCVYCLILHSGQKGGFLFLTNQRICLLFRAKPIKTRRFVLLPV